MTKPDRDELMKLADELSDKLDQMPFVNPTNLLRRVETALRRLASSDSVVKDDQPNELDPPWSYVYRYHDGVFRMSGGREINGSKPMEAVGLYLASDVKRMVEERIRSALVEVPAVKGEPEPVAWPSDGSCARCGAVPRTASGLCNTCLDEDAERYENAPADAGMREALEFYADPNNWIDATWGCDTDNITPKAVPVLREEGRPCDCGDTARKALTAPGATTKSDGGNEQYLHEVADGSWGDPPLIRAAARDRLAAIAAKKSDGSVKCSGFGECAAVNADGVLCPDDTCDYDTGVRKPGPSDPSSTRSDVTALASLQGEDAVERVARIKSLLASFHRNSCYPEAMTGELNDVARAILATGLVPDEAAVRAEQQSDDAFDIEEMRRENADNVRTLDAIADYVGCPHDEELTVDHVRQHYMKPENLAQRQGIEDAGRITNAQAYSAEREQAVRADEREKCAAEVEHRNWPNVGDARRIAAAIRSNRREA